MRSTRKDEEQRKKAKHYDPWNPLDFAENVDVRGPTGRKPTRYLRSSVERQTMKCDTVPTPSLP